MVTDSQPIRHRPNIILLVDDEPEILDLYALTLREAGLDVITAASGSEALKLATEMKPNLMLLDFKMPGMDGVEVLKHLRENPTTRDLKVVFLSAFGDVNYVSGDISTAKGLGALDFIKKGLGLDELVLEVKKFLPPRI